MEPLRPKTIEKTGLMLHIQKVAKEEVLIRKYPQGLLHLFFYLLVQIQKLLPAKNFAMHFIETIFGPLSLSTFTKILHSSFP